MFNFKYFRFYLIVISIWPCIFTNAYYYCDKQGQLCDSGKHFMCDLDSVPIKGDFLALLPSTRKIKRLFVDRQNENRNRLAGGEQEIKGGGKLPKATRMREVIWDDELAYIAGIHAKRCNIEHDKCRSTERIPNTGQNLCYVSAYEKPEGFTEKIVNSVDGWWSECERLEDGNALVENYPDSVPEDIEIGHFTVIADERCAFVGCGVALCQNCSSSNYCIEITCNYALSGLSQSMIYKKGDTSASECDYYESIPSSKYPHLCANTGKFF